jgi:hypothetical protein
MKPPGVETTCGPWTAKTGTVITPAGSTRVLVLNDGKTEFVTAADPGELLGVLLAHLEVESIGPT